MPNETITGKIYPVWNADKTERRFPQTVIEAVLGLPTYLQDQFSALADIYMPIEGITESKTGQEFVYRKSPATIKAKSLTLDRIYGKTLAWNQTYRFTSFPGDYANYCSYDTATNTFIITNAPRSYFETATDSENSIISGHKYYLAANVIESTSSLSVFIKAGNSEAIRLDTSAGAQLGKYSKVHTATISGAVGLTCWVTSGGSIKFQLYLTDLTLLYGSEIDGMTDAQILAKFESEYPGYHDFGNKLISNDAESLETTGFNKWDEETQTGYYSGSDGAHNTSAIQLCTKNKIPVLPDTNYYIKVPTGIASNAIYKIYYDANGAFISSASGFGEFTTPSNCCYLNVNFGATSQGGYGTTYNHDICINLSDPAKNGTYEPYRKTTLQLGLNNFKVKSHNIWDEEWELGGLDSNGNNTPADNRIRTKNYVPILPSTNYYVKLGNLTGTLGSVFYYDANKAAISAAYPAVGTLLTSPSNAAYMRIAFYTSYGTTYHNDICINVSSSFNGQYEPHGDIAITGGLKRAGTAFDEIVGNKYIKRVERVDMGTLDWGLNQDYGNTFYNTTPISISNAIGNLICSKYAVDARYYQFAADKTIHGTDASFSSTKRVYVKDTAYSDAATFKTAMSGAYLDYELATPIEYELVEPLVYSMAAGTTEARISPNSDGLSAPFCCDMTYSASENNDSANAQYALTAGRLLNTHKLWGQDFNGTEDVSGALSGVTTLTAIGNISTAAQLISTIATGTAPLSVASTTEVANLHSYTATKLHTQRTLWGQNFDGSGNVTGDMSSVGNIAFSASGKNIASLLYFDTTNSRVGVGATPGAYKLDVSGTFRATGNTTIGGSLGVTGATTLTGALTANGKVGIGKANSSVAQLLLYVPSTTNSGLLLQSDGSGGDSAAIYEHRGAGNGLTFGEENRDFIWRTGAGVNDMAGGGAEKMRLTNAGALSVAGNTTIGGTFTVGTSSVNKATTLYGALTASGAVSFTSTLGVTGLSTLAGGIKLTTTKKIWFGDTYYIELDSNNRLHTNAGFYSNSFITAGGVGSGSGGGSNLVKERAYDISLTQIASSDYSELIRAPYINDSDSGFMFAYSPAFLDTASQMHDYVIDAIGHEIGSCDVQWIGIAIGSTYTDLGVFDSGAFLVLAKSGSTYYWYEFEV